jgi:hypothetical protein
MNYYLYEEGVRKEVSEGEFLDKCKDIYNTLSKDAFEMFNKDELIGYFTAILRMHNDIPSYLTQDELINISRKIII